MIWIVGSKGMLGSDLETLFQKNSLSYIASDKETDITDLNVLESYTIEKFSEKENTDPLEWIINCAAYTAVDKAEDDQDLCFAINSTGAKNLAIIASRFKAKLIHISTDYVFKGDKQEAYTESDPCDPLGVYGKSKLDGERGVLDNCPQSFIIRTAWLYGKNNGNFVYTMLRLFKEKEEVSIVEDQWGSPTYTKDLSEAILAILSSTPETISKAYGIYHFTNTGKTNWYQFASTIYQKAQEMGLINKAVKLTPVPSEAYPTKAKRPQNSNLSKDKIINQFKLSIPQWENALERFLEEVKNEQNQ